MSFSGSSTRAALTVYNSFRGMLIPLDQTASEHFNLWPHPDFGRCSWRGAQGMLMFESV